MQKTQPDHPNERHLDWSARIPRFELRLVVQDHVQHDGGMIAAPRIQPMSGRTVLWTLNEGDNDHEVLRSPQPSRPVFPRHDGDDPLMDDGNFSRESLWDQEVLVAPKQQGRRGVGLNLSVRAIH